MATPHPDGPNDQNPTTADTDPATDTSDDDDDEVTGFAFGSSPLDNPLGPLKPPRPPVTGDVFEGTGIFHDRHGLPPDNRP